MREKSKLNIIFPIIALLSTCGVLFSIGLFIKDSYLETISVQIDAKILSIDYENGQKFATVTFEVENSDYVIKTPLTENEEVAVNDKIPIKYNINNPNTAIYNDHLKEILIITFISLFLIILTANKAIKITNDYRYIKKLKFSGIKLETNIVEIYIDLTIPKQKGKIAQRIRSKYFNPQDNKEYTFDSDYTYEDLKNKYENYENYTIVVYLDKTNTNLYYMDLNSIKLKESNRVEDENGKIEPVKSEKNSN